MLELIDIAVLIQLFILNQFGVVAAKTPDLIINVVVGDRILNRAVDVLFDAVLEILPHVQKGAADNAAFIQNLSLIKAF